MQRTVHAIIDKLTPAQLLGIFIFLCVPAIYTPFHTDDFFHLLMLSDNPPLPYPDDSSLWGLFSFINNTEASRAYLMQHGSLPWWTVDEFYFKFWRPVAEITHRTDYSLAPGHALFAHVHSFLWFIAISGLVYAIAKRLTKNQGLAWLAVVLYVIDGNHASAITWIANRNGLLAACFGLLCFYWHMMGVERKAPGFTLLAYLSFVLAMLSGESGIAITAFLFSFAVFIDKRGFLRSMSSLLPYALIVLVWLYFYVSNGYGANGSAISYVDPLRSPDKFALALLERIPVFVFSALGFIPSEGYLVSHYLVSPEAVKGLLRFYGGE